ncbi:MAG: helix-turn-helix domain-containing protein [Anaerolineales bacterium]|jgi:excisionase family DNA binding protein
MSALSPKTLSENPTFQVIDNHITVQEAAEITGYNVQYLRRLLRAGKLDALKIGQIWLVNLASVQAYFSRAISSNDLRCGPKSPWQPPF